MKNTLLKLGFVLEKNTSSDTVYLYRRIINNKQYTVYIIFNNSRGFTFQMSCYDSKDENIKVSELQAVKEFCNSDEYERWYGEYNQTFNNNIVFRGHVTDYADMITLLTCTGIMNIINDGENQLKYGIRPSLIQ